MSSSNATLLVVPYVGEFGWELMNWQGRVRWVVSHGDWQRVILCGPPDRRALYAMPEAEGRVVFCPMAELALGGRSNEDHRVDEAWRPFPPAALREVVESAARRACQDIGMDSRGVEFLTPGYRSVLWPTTRGHQLFSELRLRTAIRTDVVLVPRQRSLAPDRNRPASWWEDLAGRLEGYGLSVEVYGPRLDDAIRQLSRSRLAVGASTGGLHLASLCRCPHYVWGAGSEAKWTSLGFTNRQRYETIWNPFGTACRFDGCGWQPPLEHVLEQSLRALDTLGLDTGCTLPPWSLKPKWRIKRRLTGLLGAERFGGLVPWRVRELVREHLV